MRHTQASFFRRGNLHPHDKVSARTESETRFKVMLLLDILRFLNVVRFNVMFVES